VQLLGLQGEQLLVARGATFLALQDFGQIRGANQHRKQAGIYYCPIHHLFFAWLRILNTQRTPGYGSAFVPLGA
jgi:hypothetical protein